MDETIKVYKPMKQLEIERKMEGWGEIMEDKKKQIVVKRHKKQESESRLETLRNAIGNLDKQTYEREQRHPWAVIFYKWFTALCVLALMVSFVWWGVDLFGEAKADAAYSNGRSDVISEQKAEEEAKKKSQEAYKKAIDDLMQKDIQLMERFLGGIENFEDNPDYQYTPIDVETYGQCPINRVLDKAEFSWCDTLEGAIMQSGQWLEPFLSKVPTQRNHQIAEKLVKRLYAYQYPDLYEPDPMPCSSRYLWTEFTKNGLYLTSEYGNANFSNTWRAG